jgi:hypothetical protein
MCSAFLFDILSPMCEAWRRGSPLMMELKKYLRILKPDAFPNLLKWTTYPVNAAQKQLYEEFMDNIRSPQGEPLPKAMQHYSVEVISMLDRCTAVAYTGSMKIVPRQLGKIMWFGSAMHAGMLPVFNPDILDFARSVTSNGILEIRGDMWPRDATTGRPLQSTSRAQEIQYGATFKEVSHFHPQVTILATTTSCRCRGGMTILLKSIISHYSNLAASTSRCCREITILATSTSCCCHEITILATSTSCCCREITILATSTSCCCREITILATSTSRCCRQLAISIDYANHHFFFVP